MTSVATLYALRCMGSCGTARIAVALGTEESTVDSDLIDLAVAGMVARAQGAWCLTDKGRAADAWYRAEEVKAVHDAVMAAYKDFMVLNPELLDLCTAWQLRRADTDRVLELFADFDHRADAVLEALATALPRFARYRERLSAALARARSGESAYLADHLESYHTVWFQLHEDLLATLGMPRW
ncbi:hypothetical protein GCM10022243_15150 [Saccharothrix violaceirubra]|uniref:Uncharacterized protein n=1 Tax=Saccharothrix violaceirubra TaxID=413306 RepID=A0A7W7T6E5_9PSEU|nr:transcriptional regulator [Saccharothrix violaceirubra]MBB4967390.1 hypothetical protein [Saccharothrix violaceirubra]